MVVAANINLQLEHAVLLTAQADKFYTMSAAHNLLVALLRVNLELSISMSLQNTELGQSILKQVYLGGVLEMNSLAEAKKTSYKNLRTWWGE